MAAVFQIAKRFCYILRFAGAAFSISASLFAHVSYVDYSTAASFLTINDVEVKKEGADSLIAKEGGLSEALNIAFTKILKDNFGIVYELPEVEKVEADTDTATTATYEENKTPVISAEEKNACVYDYSVVREKFSDSFYIANISYRFDRDKVIELLKKHSLIEVGAAANATRKTENVVVAKIAIRSRDFLKNYSEIRRLNCTVTKFTNDFVIMVVKNYTSSSFENLCMKYAIL